MFEKKLDKLYIEVVKQVNVMIPVDWNKFWLCADLDEQCNGGVYFFFRNNQGKIIYSLDIPTEYGISEKEFNFKDMELFSLIREMKQIFIENNMEPWFQIIMELDDNSKLQVSYEYVNWFDSPFTTNDLIDYFEYKHVCKQSDNRIKKLVEDIENYKNMIISM